MSAPGSRPSFRIDPRAAERAPPPPAPKPAAPGPVAPPPPPPKPPAPGPAPQAPARERPKWLVPALIVAAIVVVAGLGYGGYKLVKSETYPEKYLLSASQAPRDMSLSDPSDMGELEGQVESGKNPGRFTRGGLDTMESETGVRPEEAWGESFDTPSREGHVVVIAMKFSSREEADDAVSRLRLACGIGGARTTLMQDDDVAVLVAAQGSEPSAYEPRVVKALRDKAPDLRVVCGG